MKDKDINVPFQLYRLETEIEWCLDNADDITKNEIIDCLFTMLAIKKQLVNILIPPSVKVWKEWEVDG